MLETTARAVDSGTHSPASQPHVASGRRTVVRIAMDVYEIRIKHCLGPDVVGAFDGFVARPASNGDTLLIGPVADQTALHGVLMQIRDFGLDLVALRRLTISHR